MPIDQTSELNLPGIVERLKQDGKLRSDELKKIRCRIAEASNQCDDIYNLARALGLGASPSNENIELLEPLLSLNTEEWGLHGVIIALCFDWGLARNYTGKLLEIAGPRTWDSHQSAALAALAALGDYLQREEDRHTVAILLEYLELALQPNAQVELVTAEEYRDAVWHALDQWMRGRQAQVRPTRFDPDSSAFRDVMARYRTLHA